MDLGMNDKVALVTGGNSGIGRATALMFAEEGAKVVISGRNEHNNEETVAMIRKRGGECIYTITDVSKEEDIKAMVEKTVSTYGRLDFAVNNAAAEGQKPFLEHTQEDWDRIVNTNLRGTWWCMKYEIAEMLKVGGGGVVNVSSIGGLLGFPLLAPYVSSKSGIIGLTRTAALEFAKQGVRVNVVCPGSFDTPMFRKGMEYAPENTKLAASMHPVGRIGMPEECAFPIVMLCSPKASFITAITLAVDGGWSQH